MDQYFSPENDALPSKRRTFFCQIGGMNFEFVTDTGVFSKSGLDYGSRTLLEAILPEISGRVLDLGCGYGPIGIVIAKKSLVDVTMTDINPRAVKLAEENVSINKVKADVIEGDGYENISGSFDWIVTNPPVRAGKKVFYPWLENAGSRLKPEGTLVFVLKKDQGALSAMKHLDAFYGEIGILMKKSGYYVVKCKKCLTN